MYVWEQQLINPSYKSGYAEHRTVSSKSPIIILTLSIILKILNSSDVQILVPTEKKAACNIKLLFRLEWQFNWCTTMLSPKICPSATSPRTHWKIFHRSRRQRQRHFLIPDTKNNYRRRNKDLAEVCQVCLVSLAV